MNPNWFGLKGERGTIACLRQKMQFRFRYLKLIILEKNVNTPIYDRD